MAQIERKWIEDGAVNPQKMEIDATLSMNGYRLTELGYPVDASDAVNLKYFNDYRLNFAFKDPVDTIPDRDATYGYWDTTVVPGTDGTPQDGWMVWVENVDTQYAFVWGEGWKKTGSTPTVPFMSDDTAGKAYLANNNEWFSGNTPRVLRYNDDRLWHYSSLAGHFVSNDATIGGSLEVGGSSDIGGRLDVGGDASVIGDLTVNGDIYAGDISFDDIVGNTLLINNWIKSALIPDSSGGYDLGSSTFSWGHLYVEEIDVGTLRVSSSSVDSDLIPSGSRNIGAPGTRWSNAYFNTANITTIVGGSASLTGGLNLNGSTITNVSAISNSFGPGSITITAQGGASSLGVGSGTGGMSLGTTGSGQFISSGTMTITGSSTSINSTAGQITITSVGGGITVDGASGATFKSSSGAVVVESTTSTVTVNSVASSAGLTAATGISVNTSAGPLNLTSVAGGVGITGGTGIGLTTTGGGAALVASTSGPITMTSGTTVSITASSGALNISASSGSASLSGSTSAGLSSAGIVGILSTAANVDIDADTAITIDTSGGPITVNAAVGGISLTGFAGASLNSPGPVVVKSTGSTVTVESVTSSLGVYAQSAITVNTTSGAATLSSDNGGVTLSGKTGIGITCTNGPVALTSSTSNISIDASAILDIDAGSAITLNTSSGGITIDASGGGVGVQATGGANFGTASGGTWTYSGGTCILSGGSGGTFVQNNQAPVTIRATNASGKNVDISSSQGDITLTGNATGAGSTIGLYAKQINFNTGNVMNSISSIKLSTTGAIEYRADAQAILESTAGNVGIEAPSGIITLKAGNAPTDNWIQLDSTNDITTVIGRYFYVDSKIKFAYNNVTVDAAGLMSNFGDRSFVRVTSAAAALINIPVGFAGDILYVSPTSSLNITAGTGNIIINGIATITVPANGVVQFVCTNGSKWAMVSK